MEKRIRVLVAKPGLDGHDRGAKVVARALRDAGFEVIYTGIRLTPEQIAEAALQEDVNVVALSLLSGAHNTLFPRIVEIMNQKGIKDVLTIGGGVIPDADIPGLKAAGIAEDDIRTTNFSIWSGAKYGPDGQPTGDGSRLENGRAMSLEGSTPFPSASCSRFQVPKSGRHS